MDDQSLFGLYGAWYIIVHGLGMRYNNDVVFKLTAIPDRTHLLVWCIPMGI